VYLAKLAPGTYTDVVTGQTVRLGDHHTFSLEPRTGMVLVPTPA
jgi:neopullulanase